MKGVSGRSGSSWRGGGGEILLNFLERKRAIGMLQTPTEVIGVTRRYSGRTGLEFRNAVPLSYLVGEAAAPDYEATTRRAFELGRQVEFYAPTPTTSEWWHVVKVPVSDYLVLEARVATREELCLAARRHLTEALGSVASRGLGDDEIVTWLRLQALAHCQPDESVSREQLLHEGGRSTRTISRHLKSLQAVGAVELERGSTGYWVPRKQVILSADAELAG